MSKVQDFIYDNNLQWQASFNDKTDNYGYAYRGSLVITPGKVLSADKQLPPKATATGNSNTKAVRSMHSRSMKAPYGTNCSTAII